MWLKHFLLAVILLFGSQIFTTCVSTSLQREIKAVDEAQQINPKAEYIKIHMTDGSVYVLHTWLLVENMNYISGNGGHYDENRKKLTDSHTADEAFIIPFEDISLIETNQTVQNSSSAIAAFTIVSVPVTLLTIYCLTDPKACFGSCPTFYIDRFGDSRLVAEGFSSSIARVLEETDIDKVYLNCKQMKNFALQLKNEALETHVIRHVDLLACPVKNNSDVYATPEGKFYIIDRLYKPELCTASEGSILESIVEFDQIERYSLADSNNLGKTEEIMLRFNSLEEGQYGLIIGSRQTLLTTFLFYQSLAYLGHSMSYYVDRLESGDKRMKKLITRLYETLGGIEVQKQQLKGKWISVGERIESGPIATDVQIIEIPGKLKDSLELKLRLTQGLWRIDYLALAKIKNEIDPIRIYPTTVVHQDEVDTSAHDKLLDKNKSLVTFPGDEYTLIYDLPESKLEYKLFIESRGYYYEWMRNEWYEEEDRQMSLMMFNFPRYYLRKMAPYYKESEPHMEQLFWNSKYVNQ